MSARDHILGNIRARLARGAEGPEHADARLRSRPAGPLPERATGSPAVLRQRFIDMARNAAADVLELDSEAEVPASVAALCREHGLALRVAVAPAVAGLDWNAAGLEAEARAGRADDRICVSRALCGVAETGTLVLASGPDSPVTLNFLPDVHVVAVAGSALVGSYEEAWGRLRERGAVPRSVNWITGPSRSADIEQTLQLGAHGPVRLVVALI